VQVAGTVSSDDWLGQYGFDRLAIRSFFDRHGHHGELLRSAVSLVERVFSPSGRLVLKVREDPEFDDEWLVIDVVVKGTVDEAFEAYREFVREWVAVSAPDLRSIIRVAYRIE
jgi:hypothetical protein